MSGAGSPMAHLRGIVRKREVTVRYTIDEEARAALVSQLSSTLHDHAVEPTVAWDEDGGGFLAPPGGSGEGTDPATPDTIEEPP